MIVYTVTGGSEAVALTHKWQMAVISAGMVTAMVVLLLRLPDGLGFSDAAHVAGALGKLQAVDFSVDPSRRYTFWTGVFGGLFLSLSYFGTDQSQVQRYIGGASLREGRLGLMFNAVLKIPMQFFILLLGALLFVFYQFAPHPVFFNQAEWRRHAQDSRFARLETSTPTAVAQRQSAIRALARRPARRTTPGGEAERADRHGRGRRTHPRGPRRGQGRPRGRRPARQDPGHRLRVHHVHPDAAAARADRPAGGRLLRVDAVVEGRRARTRSAQRRRSISGATVRPLAAADDAHYVRVATALHRRCGASSRSASPSSPDWRRT